MNLLRSAALFAAFFAAVVAPTAAQWQTPIHSVPVGQGAGVTGFGNAAPGTAGQPLLSNGPNADPSFQSASVAVNAFVTSHQIAPADCGGVVQMGAGSTWPLTLTLPASPLGNGFAGSCPVTVVGQASRGVKLSGFAGIGLTSPNILWPTKTFALAILNGTWALTAADGRWKVPNSITLFMDVLAGADTNDCLAAGAGNACATFNQTIRTDIKDYFDLSGASAVPPALINVQLADNATSPGACTTCYALAHIAFTPVGNEGRDTIRITGDAAAPGNTIISDAGGNNMGVFAGGNIELQNLQIGQSSCASSPKAQSGISPNDGGNVRVIGGVILGCATAQQIFVSNHGGFFLDGGMTVTGGGTNLLQLSEGGVADFSGQTVTCSGTIPYSQQTITAQYNSTAALAGATWSGCGSVTGTRYFSSGLSIIDTNTGTPNAVIPGNANGSVATGGVAN